MGKIKEGFASILEPYLWASMGKGTAHRQAGCRCQKKALARLGQGVPVGKVFPLRITKQMEGQKDLSVLHSGTAEMV